VRNEYPNPADVVYARPLPPGFPCQQTTTNTGKNVPMHKHGAWLNAEGTGNTDVDSGHYHRVRDFKVQPDPSDGHTHALTMLPCGAGAPRTTGQELVPVGVAVDLPDGTYVVQVQGAGSDKPFWTPWKIVGALALATGLVVGGVMLYHRYQELAE
jgi:hypothetical protein